MPLTVEYAGEGIGLRTDHHIRIVGLPEVDVGRQDAIQLGAALDKLCEVVQILRRGNLHDFVRHGRNGAAQLCHLLIGERRFPEADLVDVGSYSFTTFVSEEIEAPGSNLEAVAVVGIGLDKLGAVHVKDVLAVAVGQYHAIPLIFPDVSVVAAHRGDTYLVLMDKEVSVVGVRLICLNQTVPLEGIRHHDVHHKGVGLRGLCTFGTCHLQGRTSRQRDGRVFARRTGCYDNLSLADGRRGNTLVSHHARRHRHVPLCGLHSVLTVLEGPHTVGFRRLSHHPFTHSCQAQSQAKQEHR